MSRSMLSNSETVELLGVVLSGWVAGFTLAIICLVILLVTRTHRLISSSLAESVAGRTALLIFLGNVFILGFTLLGIGFSFIYHVRGGWGLFVGEVFVMIVLIIARYVGLFPRSISSRTILAVMVAGALNLGLLIPFLNYLWLTE